MADDADLPGDRASVEAWVLSTLPRAVAFAVSLLRDRSAADDVVQDCYCRLLAKAGAYDLPRDGTRILFKSVSNACIDHARGRRESSLNAPPDDPDAPTAPEPADLTLPDPADAAARRELEGALDSALVRLPVAQRAAVEMKALGYSLKRLRILSLAHSYVVGANRSLAHAIQREGGDRLKVTIAAPTYFHGQNDLRPVSLSLEGREECDVVPVSAYLTRSVHLFCYGRRLRHLLHRQGWDLIHCWEEPYVVAGAQAAYWSPPGTPFVFRTAQSLPKSYPPPFDSMEEYVVDRCAGWICSGQTVAENLLKRKGYAERPMARIPLGVDAERFRPDRAAGLAVRARLGWREPGPPVVGYLGRFVEAKGLRFLMQVLEGLDVPWRALLIGAGPMEHGLAAWAARFPDQVRICSDVRHDDVPAYVNAMDVMCAPSQTMPNWREQFGRMLIEAFACGVPVVGSDSGEIPFVIRDTGRVAGEKDVAGWRAAIGELFASPRLRFELGEAGRERAVREYDWSVIGRAHLEFFESILDGGRPEAAGGRPLAAGRTS